MWKRKHTDDQNNYNDLLNEEFVHPNHPYGLFNLQFIDDTNDDSYVPALSLEVTIILFTLAFRMSPLKISNFIRFHPA